MCADVVIPCGVISHSHPDIYVKARRDEANDSEEVSQHRTEAFRRRSHPIKGMHNNCNGAFHASKFFPTICVDFLFDVRLDEGVTNIFSKNR